MRFFIFICFCFFSNNIFCEELPTPFTIKFNESFSSQNFRLKDFDPSTWFDEDLGKSHKIITLQKDPSEIDMREIWIYVIDDKIYRIGGKANYLSFSIEAMDTLYKKYKLKNNYGKEIQNSEELLNALAKFSKGELFIQTYNDENIEFNLSIEKDNFIYLDYAYKKHLKIIEDLEKKAKDLKKQKIQDAL